MKLKIFGDTTPINWSAMGIKMPFAPMHELAQLYELTSQPQGDLGMLMTLQPQDIDRTFETRAITVQQGRDLAQRIAYRAKNTVAALDQCTPNAVCINLGGGYHHAGKYPNMGYAYSLINDIIWAVDYQLEQDKTVGIIDLDFHFGGGTWYKYRYNHWDTVNIIDVHHPQGILQKHGDTTGRLSRSYFTTETLSTPRVFPMCIPTNVDKIILNIGTDWYKNDTLFGQYGKMDGGEILDAWKLTIKQITSVNTPLAITMGGGYGPHGLKLYESLISWLCWL